MKKINILLVSLLLFSCKSGNNKPQEQTAPVVTEPVQTQPLKQYELTELWRTDTTLKVPESVIYDEKKKVLYVANMNTEGGVRDKNGFISKVGMDGKILQLRWADSLMAPKGMAIVGDTLFTADINELVEISISTGKISGRHTVKEAKMLNDVTSDPLGDLYISDSDGNQIYKYNKKAFEQWLSFGLKGPNGLLVLGDTLYLASAGAMDFSAINLRNRQKSVLTSGINKGDGIASTGKKGEFLVSDWEGEIFLIYPDNTKVSLLNTKDKKINTADIWYIPDQNMLLVPTFFKNQIVAYKLVEKGSV